MNNNKTTDAAKTTTDPAEFAPMFNLGSEKTPEKRTTVTPATVTPDEEENHEEEKQRSTEEENQRSIESGLETMHQGSVKSALETKHRHEPDLSKMSQLRKSAKTASEKRILTSTSL